MKLWRLVVQNDLFVYAPDDATVGEVTETMDVSGYVDGDVVSANEGRGLMSPDAYLRWDEDGELETCGSSEFDDECKHERQTEVSEGGAK
jgi:hypothetical protein